MLNLLPRPDWIARAACRGMPTKIWFPDEGNIKATALARSICAICPVKAECAEYGRTQRGGVWGGKTRRNRRGSNQARHERTQKFQAELREQEAS